MSEEISIRGAVEADVPALARVWNESWHAGHAALDPEAAKHRDLPYFQARIGSNLAHIVVAVEGQGIVGFSGWEDDGIGQLFVLPTHFGRQVAAGLLHTVEEVLAKEGHTTIWLHCREGNERARAFYEKHGWRIVRTFDDQIGTHIGFMPTRAWHMEKRL